MEMIKKFLNSYLYIPTVFLISLTFWLIAYLSKNNVIDNIIIYKIENISLITFGVIALLLLVFFKNTYYFIPWVIFIPFVFARPFDALSIPSCIYIGLGLMVVGLILNIIIYKPKLKIGQFFFGLLVLCIAFVLGGINVKTDNSSFQLMITTICVVAFLLVYCLIASSSSIKFDEIARLFTYLGIFLVIQLIVFFYLYEDITVAFLNKVTNVGWGISNNIALILLFTFPFTLYLAFSKKHVYTIIYSLLTYIQIVAIIITYSRGAILSLAIGIIILIPFVIWKAKDKITLIASVVILIAVTIFGIFKIKEIYPDEFLKIYEIVTKLDFENMNGRTPIYEDCINALKEYPIFGKGVLATFTEDPNGVVVYEWGHSTILQTVRTMGSVGCIAMLFHLGQKYFVLFKKINVAKMTVIASFAISGLYGLFDVSYYFINYMIPLILCMAMLECLFKNSGEQDYEVL